ncbi:MAG: peroxiredoxin [Parachlamydiales bacterium]|nr:peroxiredoxin [Parachlamydiales bacterium]
MNKLPSFSLKDSQGNIHSNQDCQGCYTLLYFYPKDDTTGCTKQACLYRDLKVELLEKGIKIIGVNPAPSHQKFETKYELNFPILCDDQLDLCKKMEVWKEKSMYGRKYMGVERSCFLINPDGIIVWEKRNVSLAGHQEELLKVVETFLIHNN